MEELKDVQAFLLSALNHFGLEVDKTNGKHVYLKFGYQIEIENASLFKLMHDHSVIAPFDDVGELCHFIYQDIHLNE
ncbi:MAG: hypothetical protein AAF598_02310 [Bacteroidota bacterium]